MHTRIVSGAEEGRGRGRGNNTKGRRLISENSLEEREDIGVCMGCGGCGCLNDHTCLALVGTVCHGQSPGWLCLGS